MPSGHSRPHHSSQCGPVAARIGGVSPLLFHPVPVGLGHGGVWSNYWFPVCKCKSFGLQMQKVWFRHMSWVVGLSPPVVFLPEGSCTFVQVYAEFALWALVALCRTCPGCSWQNNLLSMFWLCGSIYLSLPSPLNCILSLPRLKSVICLATDDHSECNRLCILKAASQSLSDSPCQLPIWAILMHLVWGSTLLHQ